MKKHSIHFVLAAVVLLSLTGCELLSEAKPDDPIAIRSESGQIDVAICQQAFVDFVTIVERPPGGRTSSPWQLDGLGEMQSGQTVLGVATELKLQPYGSRIEASARSSVLVQFVSGDGNANGAPQAEFTIPEGGLSDTMWLQVDGTQTSDPCPQDS